MNPRIADLWVSFFDLAAARPDADAARLPGRGGEQRCGGLPLANPALIAVTALVALLLATGTPYQTYFDGAQFV